MKKQRQARHKRQGKAKSVRKRLQGNSEKPRLSVFRSSRHIYCQAIDDEVGCTLAASCSMKADSAGGDSAASGKRDVATAVGREIANKLKEKGVSRVVFDRGWYRFHGRVKALADGAREAGLQF